PESINKLRIIGDRGGKWNQSALKERSRPYFIRRGHLHFGKIAQIPGNIPHANSSLKMGPDACPRSTPIQSGDEAAMHTFITQLKQVMRRLGRAPVFTAITLVTLAAGIGANTVIFSVVEGVLLKPLPYPHADELVGVWHEAPGIGLKNLNCSPSNYFIYKEQN